ncbi:MULTISPECIES: biopolymer transporter ExbD [Persicobacter]|uniref:Biopolymer transporter ExbD n=1 Tax=Persicobacter diffluens TaxID=981 RepID=A0AAN5AIW9_9BACT|nr:biopolymer transporter ExbD [Persicobacter sp. CCB-QB2]GJM60312.1 biopolymer transporter ExbD [Persicobacter diffluens]
MSKFKKKSKASQDIPTSALPDIIFMLLFFFMTTTTMRTDDIKVQQRFPQASQLSKIEKKSLVSYIYVGAPKETDRFGTEPVIQINDVFAEPEDLILYVAKEKDKLPDYERDQINMAMKVDKEAKMGIVTDVQEALKEANALKVLYTSLQKTDKMP